MASVQVYDFGFRDGIKTYRVIGDKEDLEMIVALCRDVGAVFNSSPEIEEVHRNQWTVLLELDISPKEIEGLQRRVGWAT